MSDKSGKFKVIQEKFGKGGYTKTLNEFDDLEDAREYCKANMIEGAYNSVQYPSGYTPGWLRVNYKW